MGDDTTQERGWRGTAVGYARGAGGGLFLGLPLLMTMEMWWSGFHMPAGRLLLFLVLTFGVLVILEHYSGFREETTFLEEVQDAVVALGIGIVLAAAVLFAFAIVEPGMAAREVVGKIALQAIPLSIGASVAISQLGARSAEQERRKERAGFWGTQGIALAGAVVFGFNVAPTEEPLLLALKMGPWRALAILLLSLAMVHALVYAVEFRGTHAVPEGSTRLHAFVRTSVTSYALALAAAAYLLWTFGRIDGATGLGEALRMTIALGLATSLGAAAAKLIL
jgi:putative integral membrane protein (TIGR02587 family)